MGEGPSTAGGGGGNQAVFVLVAQTDSSIPSKADGYQ